MRIPAFALFERSLRIETRSALMGWTRAGLLLLILFFLIPTQSMARVGWYGAPGLHFLEQMAWVNFLFITLAGLSYFASAITEEKEERMLGLLRMTDLSPVAILLGKSTSRLVGSLLLLVAQIPFVLLAVTLGGVGLQQIAASYATLLAYLFLVCNLSLLFSVLFRNTTMAAAFTLGFLLLFLLGHYWAAAIERSLVLRGQANLQHGVWSVASAIIHFWHQSSPADRLGAIFTIGFAGPTIGFQVASNLVVGFLFFFLSWLVFDRCTREEKETASLPRPLFRRTKRPSRVPPGIGGTWAITWKDFTFISGGKLGLLLKFASVAFVVGLCNFFAMDGDNAKSITREFEGTVLIWVSLGMTAMFLALEAGRLFRDEIRGKTLSSLVLLPISIPELAYRKVTGALLGTLPLLGGFVLGVMLIPDAVGKFLDEILSDRYGVEALIVVILQFILFLHLVTFLSLLIKRGALPLAIAIQYVGGSFFMTFLGFIFATGGGGPDAMFVFVGFISVVLTIPLHVGIGLRLAHIAAEN